MQIQGTHSDFLELEFLGLEPWNLIFFFSLKCLESKPSKFEDHSNRRQVLQVGKFLVIGNEEYPKNVATN